MSDGDVASGERGALRCFHVWPQAITGEHVGHRRQVPIEGVEVDDDRGGRKISDDSWLFHRADGETRTLTDGVLSAVPLPLGYVGRT